MCLCVHLHVCKLSVYKGDGYLSNVMALNNSVDPIPLVAKVTPLLTASKNRTTGLTSFH